MKTEFGVYKIEPLGKQVARIGARVHCGTVRVGDLFTELLIPDDPAPTPNGSRSCVCANVALEVTKIETYLSRGDGLDTGLTGYVMVRGPGVEHLVEGASLQWESAPVA